MASQLAVQKGNQRFIELFTMSHIDTMWTAFNASEIVLPHSGHAVPLDAPIAFYKVLKEFLQD